ncbi:MAG: hypothetical protein J6S14_04880 [Clostridia bacterium]|nr:hypothetical protein [Clostridia bacterium]
MKLEESNVLQRKLIEHLKDMAASIKDDAEIKELAYSIKSLYKDNFRHNYSDFFSLIVDIAKDDNNYNLEYLSNNLVSLMYLVERDHYDGEREFKGLYHPLRKLNDHINLEIARYTYHSQNEQKMLDLEKRNEKLREELNDATKQLTEAQKKISSTQTDLIAVLSIFAAIVLTFSGSLSFLGNALSGMQEAPFFKSIAFVLICGVVIFNAIFLMMYFVGKITGRNLYAKCQTKDCTCNNGAPKCNGFKRLQKRLPYVFWFNVMLIGLLILDIVFWLLNANLDFFPIS